MSNKEIITYSAIENSVITSDLATKIMIELGLKKHDKAALILFGLNLISRIVISNVELVKDGTKKDLMKIELAEIAKLETKLSEIKKLKQNLRYYKGELVTGQWDAINLIEKDLISFKLKHRRLTSKDYFIIRLFGGWQRVLKKTGLDDTNKVMFKKILVCIFERYNISGANAEAVKKAVSKLQRENLL